MRVQVTIPRGIYERVLATLRARADHALEVEAGIWGQGDRVEIFARGADPAARRPSPGLPSLRFVLFPSFMRRTSWEFWSGFSPRTREGGVAEIGLVEDRGFCGAFLFGGEVHPIEWLSLPGAGMELWRPALLPESGHGGVPATGRWSRLAGALGGEAVLRRLQDASFCVVGVGRSGSLLAHSLARLGIRRIWLVDPDRVEPHNVDAMDGVRAVDVGRLKVEAVAAALQRDFPELGVIPFAAGLEDRQVLDAVAGADVFVSAPDAGRPRLLAALAAAHFCRPHLDVGTGVFRDQGRFAAGADIRLTLPGDGCLLCLGGVRRRLPRPVGADWREERAGSLRSLNQVATHAGLYLVERLFAGELRNSVWQRVAGRHGEPLSLETVASAGRAPACPGCAALGRGAAAGALEASAGEGGAAG